MGRYFTYVIEYKGGNSNEWKMLKAYFPYKEEMFNGEIIPEDVITTNGDKLTEANILWKQGFIRDLFLNDVFSDRGLPKDISEEAKKTLNANEQYHVSYVTIKELFDYSEKLLSQLNEDIKKYINYKYKTSKELDLLILIANKIGVEQKEIKKQNKKEDREFDYLYDDIMDNFANYTMLSGFIDSIIEIKDFLGFGYYFEEEIRIVGKIN